MATARLHCTTGQSQRSTHAEEPIQANLSSGGIAWLLSTESRSVEGMLTCATVWPPRGSPITRKGLETVYSEDSSLSNPHWLTVHLLSGAPGS